MRSLQRKIITSILYFRDDINHTKLFWNKLPINRISKAYMTKWNIYKQSCIGTRLCTRDWLPFSSDPFVVLRRKNKVLNQVMMPFNFYLAPTFIFRVCLCMCIILILNVKRNAMQIIFIKNKWFIVLVSIIFHVIFW